MNEIEVYRMFNERVESERSRNQELDDAIECWDRNQSVPLDVDKRCNDIMNTILDDVVKGVK
jgi:hypothetical protein